MSFKERIERAFPVLKDMLARTTPIIRQQLVAGGAAGEIAVSNILKDDQIVSVFEIETASNNFTDRTSEFVVNTDTGQIVRKDGYIDNTGGTATTGDQLLVTWLAYAEA